jgi:hypothetical protein
MGEHVDLQSRLTSDNVPARMRGRSALITALLPTILVGLAVAGLLLGAAGIPHSHSPGLPGLYNQEHDLSYLATFGGGAPLPDAPSAAPLVVLVVLVAVAGVGAPPIVWRRHADFRAPPLS